MTFNSTYSLTNTNKGYNTVHIFNSSGYILLDFYLDTALHSSFRATEKNLKFFFTTELTVLALRIFVLKYFCIILFSEKTNKDGQ